MTSAFFVYDELELGAFNNAKKDKLEKASVNLGIDKGFKYLRDNLVISNFSTLISETTITTSITNSICAGNIDNASSYTYQIRVQGLTSDLSLDDYNNYGYEYFIRRTTIDDNNIDYTIISCAIFNDAVASFTINHGKRKIKKTLYVNDFGRHPQNKLYQHISTVQRAELTKMIDTRVNFSLLIKFSQLSRNSIYSSSSSSSAFLASFFA